MLRTKAAAAYLLVGALNEAAIVIASARDPKRTGIEMLPGWHLPLWQIASLS
jgi:hypothetical protein